MKSIKFLFFVFLMSMSILIFSEKTLAHDSSGLEDLSIEEIIDISEKNLLSNHGISVHVENGTKENHARKVGACAYGNGICDALMRGDAKVYTRSKKFRYSGYCWQCKKCKTVYITQYPKDTRLGYVNSWQASYNMSVMTILYSDVVSSTNLTYIPGVQLRYN